MATEDKMEIKNNEFLRQFESKVDGKIIKLEYSLHPRKIFLTKFKIDDRLKEEGFDQKFLEGVFDRLALQKLKVVPSNREVSKFFKANKKKYKELLPTGINI